MRIKKVAGVSFGGALTFESPWPIMMIEKFRDIQINFSIGGCHGYKAGSLSS